MISCYVLKFKCWSRICGIIKNSNVSLRRVWPFSVWVLCWSRIRLHDLPFQDCRKWGGGRLPNFSRNRYSKVLNNSAARLSIFKIFSYHHGLIWTYTLIKIQLIFPPKHLLSTAFYFFSILNASCSLFFVIFASMMHLFSCISILLLVSRL